MGSAETKTTQHLQWKWGYEETEIRTYLKMILRNSHWSSLVQPRIFSNIRRALLLVDQNIRGGGGHMPLCPPVPMPVPCTYVYYVLENIYHELTRSITNV